jgi:hypothetical protein
MRVQERLRGASQRATHSTSALHQLCHQFFKVSAARTLDHDATVRAQLGSKNFVRFRLVGTVENRKRRTASCISNHFRLRPDSYEHLQFRVLQPFTGLLVQQLRVAPEFSHLSQDHPGSVILSGVMMFEYLGWTEVRDIINKAFAATIQQKKVTYDLERLMKGATKLKTSEFADAIISNM